MAVNNNLTDFLTDIAKKIREISGTNGAINPQDFTNRMDSFEMIPTETITLDRQGKHSVLGYAEAEVALPVVSLNTPDYEYVESTGTIKVASKATGTGYLSKAREDQPHSFTLDPIHTFPATKTLTPTGATVSGTINLKAGYYSAGSIECSGSVTSRNITKTDIAMSGGGPTITATIDIGAGYHNAVKISNSKTVESTTLSNPSIGFNNTKNVLKINLPEVTAGWVTARGATSIDSTIPILTVPASKTLTKRTGATMSGDISLSAGYYKDGKISCSATMPNAELGTKSVQVDTTYRRLVATVPVNTSGYITSIGSFYGEIAEAKLLNPQISFNTQKTKCTISSKANQSGYLFENSPMSISLDMITPKQPSVSLNSNGTMAISQIWDEGYIESTTGKTWAQARFSAPAYSSTITGGTVDANGYISLGKTVTTAGVLAKGETVSITKKLSSQILQRSDIEFSQSSGTSYYSITATTIIPTGGYYAKGTRASNTFNIVKRTLPELVVSETPNGYTVTSKIVQSGYYTANDSRTTTISTGSGETNLPTCTLKILSWSGERQNFRCYVQENGIIKKKAVTLNTVKYIGPGEKEPGETIVNNVVIGSTVYISYMFMKPITASPAIAIYDNTPSPSQYDSHAEMAIKQGTASGSNVSITIHG